MLIVVVSHLNIIIFLIVVGKLISSKLFKAGTKEEFIFEGTLSNIRRKIKVTVLTFC
jgi:hypothetical protein